MNLARARSALFAFGLVLLASAPMHAMAQAETIESLSIETLAGTATVQMPCEGVVPTPPLPGLVEGFTCSIGDLALVFAVSQGEGATNGNSPLPSAFEEATSLVEDSVDTVMFETFKIDGRNALRASQGPEPKFGTMVAIELGQDTMVFAVVLRQPGIESDLREDHQRRATDFVNSLQVLG